MSDIPSPELWITETHRSITRLGFRVTHTLFSGQSPYQRVDIVETAGHGRMLLNDGMVMLSERDEAIYHEMIAHVPLFVHPAPRTVLIIGGGDGGTAREVLRHAGIRRVVLVEIDAMVVAACREHLPSVSAALSDPRLELRMADGVAYMRDTDELYDVILVDSTDPVGPAAPLFDGEFYRNAARRLTAGGILISQAESPFYDGDIQSAMLAAQRPFFERLHLYQFSNLTYPGGLWSFGFAAKGLCPIADFQPDRPSASGLKMEYYTPAVHHAAFALPAFLEKRLNSVLDPLPSCMTASRLNPERVLPVSESVSGEKKSAVQGDIAP